MELLISGAISVVSVGLIVFFVVKFAVDIVSDSNSKSLHHH